MARRSASTLSIRSGDIGGLSDRAMTDDDDDGLRQSLAAVRCDYRARPWDGNETESIISLELWHRIDSGWPVKWNLIRTMFFETRVCKGKGCIKLMQVREGLWLWGNPLSCGVDHSTWPDLRRWNDAELGPILEQWWIGVRLPNGEGRASRIDLLIPEVKPKISNIFNCSPWCCFHLLITAFVCISSFELYLKSQLNFNHFTFTWITHQMKCIEFNIT